MLYLADSDFVAYTEKKKLTRIWERPLSETYTPRQNERWNYHMQKKRIGEKNDITATFVRFLPIRRTITFRSPSHPLPSRSRSKLVEAGGVLAKKKRCAYGTGSYARRTRAVEIAAQAGRGSACGKEERGRDDEAAEPETENVRVAGGKGDTGGGEGFNREAGAAKGGMSCSPVLTATVSPSSPTPPSSRSSSIPLSDEGELARTMSERHNMLFFFVCFAGRRRSWLLFATNSFPLVFSLLSGWSPFKACAAHWRKMAKSRIIRSSIIPGYQVCGCMPTFKYCRFECICRSLEWGSLAVVFCPNMLHFFCFPAFWDSTL